jgi:hypothetical protein
VSAGQVAKYALTVAVLAASRMAFRQWRRKSEARLLASTDLPDARRAGERWLATSEVRLLQVILGVALLLAIGAGAVALLRG